MEDSIDKIKKEVFECKKCRLFKERKNPVVGEGDIKAKVMFIGEAPGKTEDERGIPFCGRAGKVFDELLEKIEIRRSSIYITNILKCRPPNNRDPYHDEIVSCTPYLDHQINLIMPKIICCLGNFSISYIMKKFGLENMLKGISKIHGRIFYAKSAYGNIKIIPLYHPAVVIYNGKLRKYLERDFQLLGKLLKEKSKEN